MPKSYCRDWMSTTLQFGKLCCSFSELSELKGTAWVEMPLFDGRLLDRTGSGAYRFLMEIVGGLSAGTCDSLAGCEVRSEKTARST